MKNDLPLTTHPMQDFSTWEKDQIFMVHGWVQKNDGTKQWHVMFLPSLSHENALAALKNSVHPLTLNHPWTCSLMEFEWMFGSFFHVLENKYEFNPKKKDIAMALGPSFFEESKRWLEKNVRQWSPEILFKHWIEAMENKQFQSDIQIVAKKDWEQFVKSHHQKGWTFCIHSKKYKKLMTGFEKILQKEKVYDHWIENI